ncbi:hypothetical protein ACFVT2_20365 [Streptomyces sp. NPDC058000]|uniref:hypothetical protein n=1 Tax=Streptomyces sp. NPDC058000 TaxID=3346299 RepID=UPI0036EBC2D9
MATAAARSGVLSSLAVSAAAVLGAVAIALAGGVPAHAEGRVTRVAGAGGDGVAASRAKDADPLVVVGGAGASVALVGGALLSGRGRKGRG